MLRLFVPETGNSQIIAFFTGKNPGADPVSISRLLGIELEKIYLPIQKHTDKIVVAGAFTEPKIADAVITREKGILIGIQVADCVPILFHDRRRDVIGAVHAGWRGTAAGILQKSVQEAMTRYSCSAEDLFIYIGPSIRRCCYRVDSDVVRAVGAVTGSGDYHTQSNGIHLLDLAAANKCQALHLGIPDRNISTVDACTHCSPDQFYSYRYAKGPTGRQGGFIGMLPLVTHYHDLLHPAVRKTHPEAGRLFRRGRSVP